MPLIFERPQSSTAKRSRVAVSLLGFFLGPKASSVVDDDNADDENASQPLLLVFFSMETDLAAAARSTPVCAVLVVKTSSARETFFTPAPRCVLFAS
jgi:hypothetical protein